MDCKDRETGSIKVSSLRKISGYYNDLLRLKLFYKVEMRRCLEYLGANLSEMKYYILDLPFLARRSYIQELYLSSLYRSEVSSIFRFLIAKSDDNDYALERVILLNYLYVIVFFDRNPSSDIEDLLLELMRSLEDDNVENIFGLLRETAEVALENLNNELKKCETDVHLLKFINRKDLNIFGKTHAIKTFGRIFRDEVERAGLKKYAYEKVNCYSSMVVAGKNYISINGYPGSQVCSSSKHGEIIRIFKGLLGCKDTEYVGNSDNTRYYFENKYITLQQFQSANPEKYYNRMFSCCERKLLAKLLSLNACSTGEVRITTTKYPCELCERAIKKVRENGYSIKPRSSNYKIALSEDYVKRYDEFAGRIFDTI